MITIVDSGGANLTSVQAAFARLAIDTVVSNHPDVIQQATHVILPGVGAANKIMTRLTELDLIPVLQTLKQPVLGICVGMQLLLSRSDEGDLDCLQILPGRVKQLQTQKKLVLPHMGWNTIEIRQQCPLLNNIPNQSYFYFVHSYATAITEHCCASTDYGESFASVLQFKNYFATQFHPERSGKTGLQLLRNFSELS